MSSTDSELSTERLQNLPARMLNEYAYCPRLFFLEHVQGDWRESVDTLDGTFKHRRVDAKDQILSGPGGSDEGDDEAVSVVEHARSV